MLLVCVNSIALPAQQRYDAQGLVLKVDPAHKRRIVSCKAITGYMDAMTMPIVVDDAKQLAGVQPGSMIDFVLVASQDSAYAESVRVHVYQGLEPDPLAARRLRLLAKVASPPAVKALAIGDAVPDFTFTDQEKRKVRLSTFRRRIVVLNFIYMRCATKTSACAARTTSTLCRGAFACRSAEISFCLP
jgi:Cu/Ag efflux protein CusF